MHWSKAANGFVRLGVMPVAASAPLLLTAAATGRGGERRTCSSASPTLEQCPAQHTKRCVRGITALAVASALHCTRNCCGACNIGVLSGTAVLVGFSTAQPDWDGGQLACTQFWCVVCARTGLYDPMACQSLHVCFMFCYRRNAHTEFVFTVAAAVQ